MQDSPRDWLRNQGIIGNTQRGWDQARMYLEGGTRGLSRVGSRTAGLPNVVRSVEFPRAMPIRSNAVARGRPFNPYVAPNKQPTFQIPKTQALGGVFGEKREREEAQARAAMATARADERSSKMAGMLKDTLTQSLQGAISGAIGGFMTGGPAGAAAGATAGAGAGAVKGVTGSVGLPAPTGFPAPTKPMKSPLPPPTL